MSAFLAKAATPRVRSATGAEALVVKSPEFDPKSMTFQGGDLRGSLKLSTLEAPRRTVAARILGLCSDCWNEVRYYFELLSVSTNLTILGTLH